MEDSVKVTVSVVEGIVEIIVAQSCLPSL